MKDTNPRRQCATDRCAAVARPVDLPPSLERRGNFAYKINYSDSGAASKIQSDCVLSDISASLAEVFLLDLHASLDQLANKSQK
jgi:hypothetical protein